MGEKMPLIELDATRGENIKISVLSNAIYYFLQYVLIILQKDNYRLLVIHNGKVLTDESYDSAKGAKIAFLKLYWHHAWEEDIKPEWTPFYIPESNWLTTNFIFKHYKADDYDSMRLVAAGSHA